MVSNITNNILTTYSQLNGTDLGINGSYILNPLADNLNCRSPVILSNGNQITIKYAIIKNSSDINDIPTGCHPDYQKGNAYSWCDLEEAWYDGAAVSVTGRHILENNESYLLSDGSLLRIDCDGNYKIEDKDAKVTYKANNIRDFSPHINASDLIAKFVEYVGSLGIKRSEVLGLPLHLLISWLIIEAAERDGDQIPPEIKPVKDDPIFKSVVLPRCLECGRFVSRLSYRQRFPFCSIEHGQTYIEYQKSQQLQIGA